MTLNWDERLASWALSGGLSLLVIEPDKLHQ